MTHSTLEHIAKKYKVGTSGRIEIPNVDRFDLGHLFKELGYKVGVEIGTERGVYSKALCRRNTGLKLYCVDPWKAYKGYREHVSQEKLDGFFEETKKRMEPYNAELVRKFSLDAVKDFEDGSLDFVYIDGNHEFSHAVADIAAWTPKVRVGGIVAGHDYIKRTNPEYLMGVIPAIHGFCDAFDIDPLYVLGRKEMIEGEKRDKQRSWMFVVERNPYAYTR